jgi:hypothetical protein
MKLETAIKQLHKEIEFLGYKNIAELLADLESSPLAFPQRTLEAYRVYRDLAYA